MEKLYTSKLIRLGTSLVITIPKAILRAQNFERGDTFIFGVYQDNTLLIKKLSSKQLSELRPPAISYDNN